MSMIVTKKFLIDLKFPAKINREFFEKVINESGQKCEIEYKEDGNPMVFTDHPVEIRQKIMWFYSNLVDLEINVYNLEDPEQGKILDN